MEKQQPEHIHTPYDGRGIRDVFVDGELVKYVTYADTKRGKVVVYRHPLKLDKYGRRAMTKTIYGRVEVVFREQP